MTSEEQRARRGERFLRLADVRSSGASDGEAAKKLGDAAVTLLEGSPEGVAIIDGAGLIVYWNEAAEAQFGLERSRALDEMSAEEMLRLVYPVAPHIFAKAGPACVSGPCPEGKMCCGRTAEVRAKYEAIKQEAGV